jgi:hypothetical protein
LDRLKKIQINPRIIFYPGLVSLLLSYNQLKQNKMKRDIGVLVLQVWSACLMLMFTAAIVFAVVQLVTGNYHGTASREF